MGELNKQTIGRYALHFVPTVVLHHRVQSNETVHILTRRLILMWITLSRLIHHTIFGVNEIFIASPRHNLNGIL